jgi:serine phosphatase RsbU (regulator of sigma subunit)
VLLLSTTIFVHAQNQGVDISTLEGGYAKSSYSGNNLDAGNYAVQIANHYWKNNDKKTAQEYFKKAVSHFEKTDDRKSLGESYEMIGYLEASNQNFLLAVNAFNAAFKAFKSIGDTRAYSKMLINIGSALIDAQQYSKAIEPLKTAKDNAEDLDDNEMMVEAFNLLSLSYERLGDKESALFYLKQMSFIINKDKKKYFEQIQSQRIEQERASQVLAAKENIIKNQKKEIINLSLEKELAEKESRLKELQVDSLNKQKQLDELIISQQESELRSERIILYIAVGSLLIFLTLSGMLFRINEVRKKTNRILEKQNTEINEQKSEIEEQKNTLIKQNDDLKEKQKRILEQQEEIEKIVENLERANMQISFQKDEVESQKEEVERSYQTIRSLSVIGQAITSTLQQETLLAIVHKNLTQLMTVDVLGIGLPDENKHKLFFKGLDSDGKALESYEEFTYNLEQPSVKCFMKDREILVSDLHKYTEIDKDFKFFTTSTYQTQSAVFLPLSYDNQPIGVLTVQSQHSNAYTKMQIGMLKTLATYISIGLQNAKSFAELESAKKTIEAKNRNIVDSIRYAEQIQKAILPDEEEVMSHFSEMFVFYQPKDIVSGDFYWFRGTKDYALVIVADCTGHGVPGAFMSMIGATMIDEIVNRESQSEPAQLLEKLHLAIRTALQQDVRENEDGMDVCVCKIELGEGMERRVTYSGAKRPLYISNSNGLEVIEADRKSIGGRQKEGERTFTNKTLMLKKGDMIYLTSDGYADQHNDKNEKFGAKAFKELLAKISTFDAEKQKKEMEWALKVHQGKKSQRDDVTVIGFRI